MIRFMSANLTYRTKWLALPSEWVEDSLAFSPLCIINFHQLFQSPFHRVKECNLKPVSFCLLMVKTPPFPL